MHIVKRGKYSEGLCTADRIVFQKHIHRLEKATGYLSGSVAMRDGTLYSKGTSYLSKKCKPAVSSDYLVADYIHCSLGT